MPFVSRRIAACLWCLLLSCGRVEEGEKGGTSAAGDGSVAGTDAVSGSAGAGGAVGVAGTSSGGVAGTTPAGACSVAKPICVYACDNNLIQGDDEACPDGTWRCPPGKVDIESCPADSIVACLGKEWLPCSPSCQTQTEVEPACVNRQYECINGTVSPASCPIDSCARRDDAKCCFPNGTVKTRSCGSDGNVEACPSGSQRTIGQCYPTGVTANSCKELDGRECAADDWVCEGACHLKCTCQTTAAGRVWSCFEGTCFPD